MRRSMQIIAAAVAALPMTAAAQTVLFSDNFDAGTSGTRYDFYNVDTEAPGQYGNGTIAGDASANFNFNYGAYTYRYTDPDGVTPRTGFIPMAPRSSGTTVGLRLDVNNANGGTGILNLYPKLTEFLGGLAPSGDHRLSFDLWMNYNGAFEGGGGSTEWWIGGINQEGGGLGGPRLGSPLEPPGVKKGFSFATNGERGNSIDYRLYRDNTRFGTIGVPEAGYAAAPDGTFSVADGRNSFYQNLFQFPDYETPGAIGKKWNQVDIEYIDGIVYFSINGNLIAARSDTTSTSGNILLGYADFNNSTAALDDITGVDSNFGLFDNVSVTQVTQVRPTWAATGGGDWSNAANWQNGVPDGVAAVADFGASITGAATINVDGGKTVRSIVFDNSQSYTISGSDITFNTVTTGVTGSIVARSGSHTIASNVTTNRPLVLSTTSAGASVALTGDLTTNNFSVTKTGPGTASVKNVQTTSSLNVTGGTMRIGTNGTPTGTSKVGTLSIAGATDAWTAKLDVTNNAFIVDYTGASPLAAIQNQIQNGRSGGSWTGNGITSSIAAGNSVSAVGYAEAFDLGLTNFGGLPVDDTAVVFRYTRLGDANLDGTTNIGDFSLLGANFNQPGVWRTGDFNYDGSVNIGDFSLLAANFNQVAPADAMRGAAVPEPVGATMILYAAAALRRRPR